MRGKAYGRYRPSRKERRRGVQDKNAWLTTYADAVTLLLAFFVLLFTFSNIDMHRFSEFIEGLRIPFGNVAADGVLDGSSDILDGTALDPADRPAPIDRDTLMEQIERLDIDRLQQVLRQIPIDSLEAASLRAEAEAQLDNVEDALDDALAAAGLTDLVDRSREERGLVISVSSDDILFALGSIEISPVGAEVIQVVSEALDPFPNPIQVEGHTDDIPVSRPGYTNWNLSSDRAVAVLSRMIELHGLPPTRVGAVGYGEYHPVESNRTAEGRARNRRVDIVVLLEGWEVPW